MEIRRLAPAEWPLAWPVVAQLRTRLDEAAFLSQVELQSRHGYELVAAFRDNRPIAVMGMRPVHTLARGLHLHIDDLVVDETCRQSGIGQTLLDYAEADARTRRMSALFLDARPEAIPFYEKQRFAMHVAPLMRRGLD
ncbi:MAG: GNAT family N-acetyltransferase [Paludibacterium sp.]|uniref:GNAT family N-acetyltransferase n=1 Tax=Paludibacterium sp. TaxID=1917523 RepID=UPI0025D82FA1|nr:GNAT family N-acetyltransferase [Paludibacterium sp.]MBV8049142.1 GNAT family N-acetyltransferase [Paludibacterium sp.]MBV8646979.1 GNAT family N-acetyltransferase [Paludibacterium sp.]